MVMCMKPISYMSLYNRAHGNLTIQILPYRECSIKPVYLSVFFFQTEEDILLDEKKEDNNRGGKKSTHPTTSRNKNKH